jgi:hypothetical protein
MLMRVLAVVVVVMAGLSCYDEQVLACIAAAITALAAH